VNLIKVEQDEQFKGRSSANGVAARATDPLQTLAGYDGLFDQPNGAQQHRMRYPKSPGGHFS